MDNQASERARLRDALIEAGFAAGFLPDQIAAYLTAAEEFGVLSPDKPSWIPKSVLFRIGNGWRPSYDRFQVFCEFVGRRVDKWLAEPHTSPIAEPAEMAGILTKLTSQFPSGKQEPETVLPDD